MGDAHGQERHQSERVKFKYLPLGYPAMAIELRKTRFVGLSDTHNASPADGAFKLPKGDVLIHAGDLTKQGTFAELQKTLNWIEQAEFEVKIVVAGKSFRYTER